MVLMGIVGELGAGKTTCMTFLGWKNWFFREKKIFSNYHLFKIPYIYISSVKQMASMKDGYCIFDEMWRIADSRLTKSEVNQLTSDILSRSRKRDLHYVFTAQLIDSIDKRIRKVIDFTALPLMNRTETICKVIIFRSGYPKESNFIKVFYFKTPLVFQMFDTQEEIDMEVEDENEAPIVFQEQFVKEHGYLCECEKCNTKFFDSWEKADEYARDYWRKRGREFLKVL